MHCRATPTATIPATATIAPVAAREINFKHSAQLQLGGLNHQRLGSCAGLARLASSTGRAIATCCMGRMSMSAGFAIVTACPASIKYYTLTDFDPVGFQKIRTAGTIQY
jgi:hypothetical protein